MKLTENQIFSGNKLIGAFMRPEYFDGTNDRYLIEHKADVYILPELEYHSSWDWLMPVIEKIESIHGAPFIKSFGQDEMSENYLKAISGENCEPIQYFYSIEEENLNSYPSEIAAGRVLDTKLDAAWTAVVDFIKNNSKK